MDEDDDKLVSKAEFMAAMLAHGDDEASAAAASPRERERPPRAESIGLTRVSRAPPRRARRRRPRDASAAARS